MKLRLRCLFEGSENREGAYFVNVPAQKLQLDLHLRFNLIIHVVLALLLSRQAAQ